VPIVQGQTGKRRILHFGTFFRGRETTGEKKKALAGITLGAEIIGESFLGILHRLAKWVHWIEKDGGPTAEVADCRV